MFQLLRLFDWRPEKQATDGTNRPKNEKVVVLKNMFDPTDFDVSQIIKYTKYKLLLKNMFDPAYSFTLLYEWTI